MQARSVTTTEEGRVVASKVLDLWKQRPNFWNGGEIDNLLSRAVCNFQGRFGAASEATRLKMAAESVLMPEDFDPEYTRGTTSSEPEFGLLGLERSLAVFRGLVKQARIMKRHKKDPKTVMPFNLVFKGPPGTGKTSFARLLGQIYYDMGILSSKDVVEASGNDLMGGYVGQTSMQTTKLIERSLGKVLLIDEAYQLGGTGSVARYAKEARDTLVYLLTNPGYQHKLVVVLVGYESEMDSLLKENPGLSGRFPQHIYFESLPSRQCLLLLKRNIENLGLATSFKLDDVEIIEYFDRLRLLGSWANGRDVETLAGQIVRSAFERLPDGDDCDLVLPTADQTLVLPALLQWLDNFGAGGCS